MGYPALSGIQTAYEYLDSGSVESDLNHLFSLIQHTHTLLISLCTRLGPPRQIFRINEKLPESPIIPLFTSHARSLAAHCQKKGFMLRPIVAPTVTAGTERVRLCLHAGNTVEEIRLLCKAIEKWVCKQMSEAISTLPVPSRLALELPQTTSKL